MKNLIDLATNTDARVWAKEFVRINGGDESLMIAWFANAIMCGYDHAKGNPPLCGDHLQHLLNKKKRTKKTRVWRCKGGCNKVVARRGTVCTPCFYQG